jgi:hypothetical protein
MRVLTNRRAVIEWAAGQHAYPVQKIDDPSQVELSKVGEAEAGWRRVGWEQLFAPLDQLRRVIVVTADDGFEHRILPLAQAHAELPASAFGHRWWQTLLHEVWLVRRPLGPAEKPAA